MRRVLFVLLILNDLLLPLNCIPALFLFNAVNPMQLAFIVEFTVENRTGKTIYITPVGTVGPEGHRRPLPMAVWKVPWVPASQRGRFPVRTGETITLYYDWDDINFSELVVETEEVGLRQLIVNPNPTANQYTVPGVTEFVIEDLNRLGPLDPAVREAYDAAQKSIHWWPILAGLAMPAVTFVLLLRCYKRARTTRLENTAEPATAAHQGRSQAFRRIPRVATVPSWVGRSSWYRLRDLPNAVHEWGFVLMEFRDLVAISREAGEVLLVVMAGRVTSALKAWFHTRAPIARPAAL